MSPAESQALAEGQRLFGKYILRRFLGRGPLGAAWLVMDEGIGREMAMRFLPASWARDERIKAALQAALGRWRELAHPHIVTAQNAVSDGAHAAIITRFVEAETLNDLKSHQPDRCFSVSRIQPWMAQLCDALDYAWRHHQMIHGDINPLNLLITKDDTLRVADFGLARSLFDLKGPDGTPVLVGTLAYISPERARGAQVTVADDVYAFGATVFDAVTSRPPFFRGNILWQLESVVASTMNDRRTELGIGGEPVPPEWEEVIAACLTKEPGDRPKSIREVGERLELLSPMPPGEIAPPLPVFQRTTNEYNPPPARPRTEPIEIYPSSMPTAGMEPMTMAGVPDPPDYTDEELEATLTSRDVAAQGTAEPEKPPNAEDDVRFTMYQPEAIVPETWASLLVFAHVSELPDDAAAAEPGAEVKGQGEALPGAAAQDYESVTRDSLEAVPRQGLITVVPYLEGVEFDPPRQSFRRVNPVHRTAFRMRASPASQDQTVRGRVSIFLGAIIVAEVPLALKVERKGAAKNAERERTSAHTYRKIFPCYSRKDTAIVDQCEHFAKLPAGEYLPELTALRDTQEWNESRFAKIEEAEVFQLFWSMNAARSAAVRKEWEYALSLNREEFIQPVVWDRFAVEGPELPPVELRHLHFSWLGFGEFRKESAVAAPLSAESDDVPKESALSASRVPTDTAPWATPLTSATRPGTSTPPAEAPAVEPAPALPAKMESVPSESSPAAPVEAALKGNEAPAQPPEAAKNQPEAAAAVPPEPVQSVATPPPSVVAIPPMDPTLEHTLPHYPTSVGSVPRPADPVASVPAAAPEQPPPPLPPPVVVPAPVPQPQVAAPPPPPASAAAAPPPLAPPPLPTPVAAKPTPAAAPKPEPPVSSPARPLSPEDTDVRGAVVPAKRPNRSPGPADAGWLRNLSADRAASAAQRQQASVDCRYRCRRFADSLCGDPLHEILGSQRLQDGLEGVSDRSHSRTCASKANASNPSASARTSPGAIFPCTATRAGS
jgi:serine/threonine protein kinase